MLSIHVIRIRRSYSRMVRQHKRKLTWLLCGVLILGIYYLWSAGPLDPLAVPFEHHGVYMNERRSQIPLKSRQSYDWIKAPFVKKIRSYIHLPADTPRRLPRVQFNFKSETGSQRQERDWRKMAVRDEFQRTWENYRQFAWGQDELKPTFGEGLDTYGGWGATLVDSLDTLWIMGFRDYFHEAVQAVAAIDFGKSDAQSISVFETTIRYLGGLVSAYDLSHEPVLLEKAIQVGEMLYRAFDTTNNTPLSALYIEIAKLTSREELPAETRICFACIGSLSMEFTRLAQITSELKYYDVVAKLTLMMDRTQNKTKVPGLWPTYINAATEEVNEDTFSIGALADSAYEYFPKMHALLGGLEPVYEKLFKASAATMDKRIFFRAMIPDEDKGASILFSGDLNAFDNNEIQLSPRMQHLTCFIGGMFGLAGRLFQNKHYVDLGGKLTKGCVFAYESMPTGIMPETFFMLPCENRTDCPWNEKAWEDARSGSCGVDARLDSGSPQTIDPCGTVPGFSEITDKRYLLRPEAIESVFVMYRITGDRTYLDYAWDMFTSIVSATRTKYGNGQLTDVTLAAAGENSSFARESNIQDKMESFWTAETLKYFYLIFSRPDMISLDDWVLNTEAHPFRIPKAHRPRGHRWEKFGPHQ